MASYQIPQFLDSGDKILFSMNLRQFGYALGGFFLCTLIFSITNSLIPGIGWYGMLPVAPFAALFAYLALGKFNGRDSEIYVFKFIIFILKDRVMVYQRNPSVVDLDSKMAEFTMSKINQRWEAEAAKMKLIEEDEYSGIKDGVEGRAGKVTNLGRSIDSNWSNALSRVKRQQLEAEVKTQMLQRLLMQNQRKNGRFNITPKPVQPSQMPIPPTLVNYSDGSNL